MWPISNKCCSSSSIKYVLCKSDSHFTRKEVFPTQLRPKYNFTYRQPGATSVSFIYYTTITGL